MNPATQPKDLTGELADPPYLFVEHELAVGDVQPFRQHPQDQRSFVVIGGRVRLDCRYAGATRQSEYGYLEGWHALPGAVYRFSAVGPEPAVLLEAGTNSGPTLAADTDGTDSGDAGCLDLDSYQVQKPWGHEVWYTNNLDYAPYALKQIHMTAGHQSSLQSHQQKVETNYVVDGEATVLNGVPAPDDPTAVVDTGTLPRAGHGRRSGWSSDAGILHRVIALSTYTSIEVSTPELDDVIRWADDTNRGHGRIDREHQGVGR